ncbi:hypothetical protein GUJ93_ZPchr0014g46631 [Zizania palustris]|uniref:Secreted protein n=1 Tax=Zizania palustris TaxID=103762 RepID=A0A8J5TLF4_ZIZPA|nr:hypothetical protein GUJ93_ZPchr0014g46631 [Zizania palustris]
MQKLGKQRGQKQRNQLRLLLLLSIRLSLTLSAGHRPPARPDACMHASHAGERHLYALPGARMPFTLALVPPSDEHEGLRSA